MTVLWQSCLLISEKRHLLDQKNKSGCPEAMRIPQKTTKRLDRTDIFVNENDFVLL